MPGIGSLTVYLNSNSTGLDRGLAQATAAIKKFAAMAGAAFAGFQLKQFAQESLNLAAVQEKAEIMLARQLRNTAGMAEFSAAELKRFAAEAQNMSIFGDELVMQAQTRLLQMNSVTGEAFRQTRSVALEIASATGEDLTSVMQTLGKAMQDPVKGLKQLRAYGVDPAMKDNIEQIVAAQGREAAQLKLLADLQKRYAGAAAAAADTIEGAQKRNANAWGDLKEAIGFTLAEIFNVKDVLETSGGWFAEWADYLRKNSLQIGFAFQSVWIDIKTGAEQLYAFIAPVINQISSIVTAAANNLKEFLTAVPKWISGEDYAMQLVQPVWNLREEYAKLGDEIDRIAKKGMVQHRELEVKYQLKLEKQAMDEMAKGAAAGTKEGILSAAAEQQRKTFDAPSAIEGSQDAWRIILNAMKFTLGAKTAAPVASVSAAEAIASDRPPVSAAKAQQPAAATIDAAAGLRINAAQATVTLNHAEPAAQTAVVQAPQQTNQIIRPNRSADNSGRYSVRETDLYKNLPWYDRLLIRVDSALRGDVKAKTRDIDSPAPVRIPKADAGGRADVQSVLDDQPLPLRSAAADNQKQQVTIAKQQLEVNKQMLRKLDNLSAEPANIGAFA